MHPPTHYKLQTTTFVIALLLGGCSGPGNTALDTASGALKAGKNVVEGVGQGLQEAKERAEKLQTGAQKLREGTSDIREGFLGNEDL